MTQPPLDRFSDRLPVWSEPEPDLDAEAEWADREVNKAKEGEDE